VRLVTRPGIQAGSLCYTRGHASVFPARNGQNNSVIPGALIGRGFTHLGRFFVQVRLEILRRSFFRVLN
jgi:hypothetical protein